MRRLRVSFIGPLLLCIGALTQCTGRGASSDEPSAPLLAERRHFLECLATVYSPGFWISYNDSLYFQPKTEAQARQLEAMKVARARYVALTNRESRHEMAAKGMAASGIEERWQRKLLLPYSATNLDLTPTQGRPLRIIPSYKLVRSLAHGDALIQDAQATYFVMDFGRGADDAAHTNACLIKVGMKSYSEGGSLRSVEAFQNVALSAEEKAVLNLVAAAFQKQAAALGQEIAAPEAKLEFESLMARATDSNPYMEYLLARCYLEGKGTDKNESVGLEWMNRAAKNGSGDAKSYLEKLGRKAP